MRHDRTRTVNAPLAALDAAGLGEAMRETATDLHALLGEAGVVFEGVDTVYELDMLYTGQTHSVVVPLALPDGGLTGADIAEAFDAAYRAKYGRLLENVPMRVMNMRVAAIGRRPRFDMRAFATGARWRNVERARGGSTRKAHGSMRRCTNASPLPWASGCRGHACWNRRTRRSSSIRVWWGSWTSMEIW
jgi:N-methylhydantoinase A